MCPDIPKEKVEELRKLGWTIDPEVLDGWPVMLYAKGEYFKNVPFMNVYCPLITKSPDGETEYVW